MQVLHALTSLRQIFIDPLIYISYYCAPNISVRIKEMCHK